MAESISPELIAPCGMNCGICGAYRAYINNTPKVPYKISHCPGCRPRNKQCAFIIKRCSKLMKKELEFCYQCEELPCHSLERLDKNYRKRFNMSMIENLIQIREKGMDEFLKNQQEKYDCDSCDQLMSVHSKKCYSCDEIHGWYD